MEHLPHEAAASHAFERITEAYVALDADWRYTYANAAACAFLGRRLDELLGKHIWTEFPDQAERPFREAYEQAMAEQRPRTVEVWHPRYGRWFESRVYPAPDGLTVFFQDISERKREEAWLQARQHLLNQAQRLARVGSWSWEIAANQITWSDELYRLHGVDRASHAASFEAYLALLHPQDRERVRGIIEQALHTGGGFEFETRIRRPGGEERSVSSRGMVETDAQGRALRMQGVCQDVTARQRDERMADGLHEILRGIAAQQPLADSLQRIAALHEALNPGALCALLLLDETGRHLLLGAAPSLPETYAKAIHGLAVGEGHGSCGTAAWRCERVLVADIASHPYWADYRQLALACGLRACWSTPVVGSHGEVLGSFAVYYRTPREPQLDELADIDRMLPVAVIAIESERLLRRLRERNRFFEMSQEIFCVLDPRSERLIQFNPFLQRLTGYSAHELKTRSYRDYLRPEAAADPAAALLGVAAPERATREFVNRCVAKDGSEHLLEWTAFASPEGLLYAVARDITARRRVEQELLRTASHDVITGLPRRSLLEQAVGGMLREGDGAVWVLMLGLDRFQVVNESVGHLIGDDVLRHLAGRLREAAGPAWQLARVAGDKFALASAGAERAQVLALAERLREVVAWPVEGRDYRLRLTASVGINHAPELGDTPAALLRGAEAALSKAKREGRDRIVEFSQALRQALEERVQLGAELRGALERDELELHYQPQFRALDQGLSGFEALLRWHSRALGPVVPTRFIPVAEALGLMPELGGWVLEQAVRQLRAWREAGYRGIVVAVNVSAQQVQQAPLVEQVAAALAQHGVPAAALEIEMTESALMQNVARVRSTLDGLKALGVRLALDDFGTGYSSLAYLKQFPIDKLKIDQGFVSELPENSGDGAIVQTIIELGHQLGMLVAAEGVETPAQAALLAGLGCDELQGNGLGEAAPGAAADRLLASLRGVASA